MHPGRARDLSHAPINVYWEMTRACSLACRHCRASALPQPDPAELDTEQAFALVDQVRRLGSMLILTGGDPLERPDLFEIIAYARALHVPVAVTPATTPKLTEQLVAQLKEAGVAALGLSLDGSTPERHDAFRAVPGTFECAMRALEWAKGARLPVQVNTTVSRQTLDDLPAVFDLLRTRACPPVVRWSLFLVVPTGRASSSDLPSPREVEEMFGWVYEASDTAPFHISTVEAPHYRRYWMERRLAEGGSVEELLTHGRRQGFGVRDGHGVIFVSHLGNVYPAGFLPEPLLGNVKDTSLVELYRSHPGLLALRDESRLCGKCASCEYRRICGGSRSRAFGVTGDVFAEEPTCSYIPKGSAALDARPS